MPGLSLTSLSPAVNHAQDARTSPLPTFEGLGVGFEDTVSVQEFDYIR